MTGSPGVYIKEVDLSEVAQPAGTSVCAMVVPAYKGPVNRRVLVTNNQEFTGTFGVPVSGESAEFPIYGALETLKQSEYLYVVRPTTSADTFGYLSLSSSSTAATYTDDPSYEGTESEVTVEEESEGVTLSGNIESCVSTSDLLSKDGYNDGNKPNKWYDMEQTAPDILNVAYIGPSKYSENLALTILAEDSIATTSSDSYGYNFTGKYPSQYNFYRINVYQKSENDTPEEAGWCKTNTSGDTEWGVFGETLKATPVETWIVSNDPLAKDYNGNSMYAPEVINGISSLIYVKVNDGAKVESSCLTIAQMPGGSSSLGNDESLSTEAAVGWDLFGSKETSSPNILVAGCAPDWTNYISKAVAISSSRKDCISIVPVGALNQNDVNVIINDKEKIAGNNSSYVAIYNGWEMIADGYSGRKIYLPLACFMGAIYAFNDAVANTWDAPAGLTRGGVSALGQANAWNEQKIGILYNANINTVKKIRGSGDYVWGQKTGQVKATALDRVNVRRLLLYIENTIEPMLQNYLFEPNTEKTRQRITSVISSFLDTIYAGGGVTNFAVICDETNNTAFVIDNNELNIDLFITPARTIEKINVKVIVTNSGVDFSELLVNG